MSFLACFYLFLGVRPLLIGVICGAILWLHFPFMDGEFGFVGFALHFPWAVGLLVGIGAWRIQLGWTMQPVFIWTLPGWRRRLGTGVLVSGIAVASLSTAAVPWLGPPWILFPLMILFYFAGFYLGTRQLAPGRGFLIAVVYLLFPLIFMVFGDEIVAFCLNHPAHTLAATVVVCPAILYSVLNAGSARKRLSAPVYKPGQGGQRRLRMPWTRNVGDAWKEEFLGDGIANWLRAGDYERSGMVGGGWPKVSFTVSLFLVLAVFLLGCFMDYMRGDGTLACSHFALTLTGSPLMETAETATETAEALFLLIVVSFMVWLGFLVCLMPLFWLRRGALYPLSRLQLARLTYAGSLFQALSFTLLLGACFVAAGALVGLFSGEGYSLEDSSGILGLIAWGPVYVPLMQWFYHTMVDSKNQFKSGWLLAVYFLLVVLPWAFAGIYHHYLLAAIGAWTFAVLGALFAALQAAYYFGLRRYYARADLI